MPCNKFQNKNVKTGYFKIIILAVCFNLFKWNLAHLFKGPSLLSRINLQGFFSKFGGTVIQVEKCERVASFAFGGRKNLRIYSGYSCQIEKWPKVFHWYSFIKPSRNEAFWDFLVNFIKFLPWKR